MKLTNTACLAVLLLACPLAATAVHAADYYGKENSTPDESGKVAASGYNATLTNGSYEQIYIGYATLTQGSDAKELESSNNTGILSGGLDVASFWTRVWGGAAGSVGGEVATTSRANSNKLFLYPLRGWG
ncbi:MAG: hypothetical protein Q3990_02930 [Desulfovibrionaceae bacterium]|nr:hypothetical protein [Desulfovibrionaceae bacterium]